MAKRYADAGIALFLTNVNDRVLDVMEASGLRALVGEDHFFATDGEAIERLERRGNR